MEREINQKADPNQLWQAEKQQDNLAPLEESRLYSWSLAVFGCILFWAVSGFAAWMIVLR